MSEPLTPDELRSIREFADEIEAYEREHFDAAREAAEDAEWEKLTAQFPGEFVAFIDTWDGKTLTRRLIAHGPKPWDTHAAIQALSEAEREVVTVGYTYPPNVPLCTRLMTGEIRTTTTPPKG